MGYFLSEIEFGAVQRWWAEPVAVGAETAFHHSHAGMHLLPNRETFAGIMPGSPAVPSLMPWTPVRSLRGKGSGHAKLLGCQEENLESRRAKQRSPAVPLAPMDGEQMNPTEKLEQAKVPVALSPGRYDYFCSLRLKHPNTTSCHSSAFTRARIPRGWVRVKHIKAFQVFP